MTPDELKATRARLGLSQAKLARELDVTENTVWRWEAGMHPIPKLVERYLAKMEAKQ